MTIRAAAQSLTWIVRAVLPLEIPIVIGLCVLVYFIGLAEGQLYTAITGHVWMANPPKV